MVNPRTTRALDSRLRRRRAAWPLGELQAGRTRAAMELSQGRRQRMTWPRLSVIQGDADADLRTIPDDAFDSVILSQTLQATREPARCLRRCLRVGKRRSCRFPNFAHWQVRWPGVRRHRMPGRRNCPSSGHGTRHQHQPAASTISARCAAGPWSCASSGHRADRASKRSACTQPASPILFRRAGGVMLRRD